MARYSDVDVDVDVDVDIDADADVDADSDEVVDAELFVMYSSRCCHFPIQSYYHHVVIRDEVRVSVVCKSGDEDWLRTVM